MTIGTEHFLTCDCTVYIILKTDRDPMKIIINILLKPISFNKTNIMGQIPFLPYSFAKDKYCFERDDTVK